MYTKILVALVTNIRYDKGTHALRGASSGKGCKCSGDTQRSHICEAIGEFQSEVFQKLFWVQLSNSLIFYQRTNSLHR